MPASALQFDAEQARVMCTSALEGLRALLDVGPLRDRVESTTKLSFVVVSTESFERSVTVEKTRSCG